MRGENCKFVKTFYKVWIKLYNKMIDLYRYARLYLHYRICQF